MKIPIELIETPGTPDFDQAAEHVLRKNQELYKRLGTEKKLPLASHNLDLDEAMKAFSEIRRQYRDTLKKLSR